MPNDLRALARQLAPLRGPAAELEALATQWEGERAGGGRGCGRC
jgi:hypothetical protein